MLLRYHSQGEVAIQLWSENHTRQDCKLLIAADEKTIGAIAHQLQQAAKVEQVVLGP